MWCRQVATGAPTHEAVARSAVNVVIPEPRCDLAIAAMGQDDFGRAVAAFGRVAFCAAVACVQLVVSRGAIAGPRDRRGSVHQGCSRG
jgi:lipopolysaccharide biosynthesis regulator YciM